MTELWPWFSFFKAILPSPPRTPSVPRPSASVDAALTMTAVDLLRTVGCDELARRVSVSWHRRLTSTAGLARTGTAQILLNPRLREFPGEIDRTLRHELAHLVAQNRVGNRRRRPAAHGPEWKQACADLGIPGESRCHTLPLPRRQLSRPHVYRCPACEFTLRRVRPINKRRRRLACRDCCQQHARGRFDHRFEFVRVAS